MKPVTFNERTIMLSDVVLSGNNYACIVQQSTIGHASWFEIVYKIKVYIDRSPQKKYFVPSL